MAATICLLAQTSTPSRPRSGLPEFEFLSLIGIQDSERKGRPFERWPADSSKTICWFRLFTTLLKRAAANRVRIWASRYSAQPLWDQQAEPHSCWIEFSAQGSVDLNAETTLVPLREWARAQWDEAAGHKHAPERFLDAVPPAIRSEAQIDGLQQIVSDLDLHYPPLAQQVLEGASWA